MLITFLINFLINLLSILNSYILSFITKINKALIYEITIFIFMNLFLLIDNQLFIK